MLKIIEAFSGVLVHLSPAEIYMNPDDDYKAVLMVGHPNLFEAKDFRPLFKMQIQQNEKILEL